MVTNTDKSVEQKLIEKFKAGDSESFDQLVLTYSPKLFQVAYGLLGNKQDAEEVVQDAFVRAYKALAEFRGDSSFETWMYKITLNLARNRYHWNKRRGEGVNLSISEVSSSPQENMPENQDFELPDQRMSPDRLLENDELGSNIMSALKRLPDSLREAMILRHIDDLPYEEIAGMLRCKVGTVKSRLARGREVLRSILMNLDKRQNPKKKEQLAQ